jgi:hypothetical protein
MTLVRDVLLLAGLALLAGCSSQPRGAGAPQYGLLQEVNELLHAAQGGAGRPPAKLSDLNRYKAQFPRAYEAVKSGDVVVRWGTPLKGEGDVGEDETVLAYEKDAPSDGGFVLMSAGSVKEMSADDLKTALRK